MLTTHTCGKWKISAFADDQFIGPCVSRGYEWDGWMRQDIVQGHKSGTDLIDVGGNIGCNALMFSDYGSVHTFEPVFHEIIQQNADQNTTSFPIRVYPYALSSDNGTANIFYPKKDGSLTNYGGCSLKPHDGHIDEPHAVPMKKLDDVYTGTPSFMKVDVEGNELEVLMGAEHTLRTHMPYLVVEIFNVHESPIPPYLQSLGYTHMIPRPESNFSFFRQ